MAERNGAGEEQKVKHQMEQLAAELLLQVGGAHQGPVNLHGIVATGFLVGVMMSQQFPEWAGEYPSKYMAGSPGTDDGEQTGLQVMESAVRKLAAAFGLDACEHQWEPLPRQEVPHVFVRDEVCSACGAERDVPPKGGS